MLIAYADHEKSRKTGRGCNISPRLLFNACSFSTVSKIPFMTPVFPSRYNKSDVSDWVPPADYIREDPLQGPLEGPLQCPSGVQPEATKGPLPLAAPAAPPPCFPPLAGHLPGNVLGGSHLAPVQPAPPVTQLTGRNWRAGVS